MDVTPLPKRLTQLSEISTLIMKEGKACFKEYHFCSESSGSCPAGPSAQLLHVFPQKVQHHHHHHHHHHHLFITTITTITIIVNIMNIIDIVLRYPGLTGQVPGPPPASSQFYLARSESRYSHNLESENFEKVKVIINIVAW